MEQDIHELEGRGGCEREREGRERERGGRERDRSDWEYKVNKLELQNISMKTQMDYINNIKDIKDKAMRQCIRSRKRRAMLYSSSSSDSEEEYVHLSSGSKRRPPSPPDTLQKRAPSTRDTQDTFHPQEDDLRTQAMDLFRLLEKDKVLMDRFRHGFMEISDFF